MHAQAWRRWWMGVTVALWVAVGACAKPSAFQLAAEDNNVGALRQALATRELSATLAPRAEAARVYVVVAGAPKRLVAYDPSAQTVVWAVDAEVTSRIEVGRDFLVAVEGGAVVTRSSRDGSVRGRAQPSGEIVGLAADATRVFVTSRVDGAAPRWAISAYGVDGTQLWRALAEGQLGAPAAHGGLVYVPFLTQWLSVLDASTGASLARVRSNDDQISFVRATTDAAWFGSSAGVYRVDAKAAAGSREGASFVTASVPAQLDRARYAPDGFDPVQLGYTAFDRAHILWRTAADGDGPLTFADGGVAVHYFRFLFGLQPDGSIRWVYSHPRVEFIASTHAGRVLAAVSANGEVVAFDPATGQVRAALTIPDLGGQVVGAAFDLDGWAPAADAPTVATPSMVAALVAITRDRDARFDKVKELCVAALATLSGPEVTADLMTILADPRAADRLKETVVGVLITRRDPAGLPALTAGLTAHYDHVARTEAGAVAEIARAIAALDRQAVPADAGAAAVEALLAHLDDPHTDALTATHVVGALAALGGEAAEAGLRGHLLLGRFQPELEGSGEWRKAIVLALRAVGGNLTRETLAYVAADGRTSDDLRQAILVP